MLCTQARIVSVLAMMLAIAGGSVSAQQQRTGLSGNYAINAAAAGLSNEQKAQLTTIVAERSAALSQFNETTQEELESLQQALAAARQSGNREARSKAQQERDAYNARRAELLATYDARIRALMTSEQQIKWDAAPMFAAEMRRFSRAQLSDEQREKVRAMTIATSRAIHGLTGSDEDKAAKTGELRQTLQADIREHVLTDEQRTAVAAPRAAGERAFVDE
jgi:hypothetical protein